MSSNNSADDSLAEGQASKHPKKSPADDLAEGPASKRPKKSPADDLVCPISLELTWDPVVAEDGRVYDRSSIEAHFNHHQGDLKSPITNEYIGTKLLPAVQHRNTIETLLECGVIDGDLAAKWNEKVLEKKAMEEHLKKAEGGDSDAMWQAGYNFEYGLKGFKKDRQLAFQWYKKASKVGSVKGIACLGHKYLTGMGVAQRVRLGMHYTSLAAGQGSNLAAYILGVAFADGIYGMDLDEEMAVYWLEKALSDCSHDHFSEEQKASAQQTLDRLKPKEAEEESASVAP